MKNQYFNLQKQAKHLLTLGKEEESLNLWQKCLDINEKDIANHIYVGLILLLQGDEESADFIWLSAVLDEYHQIVEDKLGLLIKTLDQQSAIFLGFETEETERKSEIIYRKLIEFNPSFPNAYLGLGIILMNKKEYQRAIAYFGQFVCLDPDFSGVYNYLGLCYMKINSFDSAIFNLEKAINLQPDNFDYYEKLISCLLINQEVAKAFTVAENIKQKHPQRVEGYIFLAKCFYHIENLKNGIENLYSALEICPYSTVVYVHILKNLKRCQEIRYYQDDYFKQIVFYILRKAVKYKASSVGKECLNLLANNEKFKSQYYLFLVEILLEENSMKEVIAILEKALSIYPQELNLYHKLFDCFDKTHQLDKGEKIIEDALKIEVENIYTLYLYAKIKYRKGRTEEAVTILHQIISKENNKFNNEEYKNQKLISMTFQLLGIINDKNKQYDNAFCCFVNSKKVIQNNYNKKKTETDELLEYLSYIETEFNDDFIKKWKDYELIYDYFTNQNNISLNTYPKPVFLVGFPRSGTTLLGQMLNNHNNIYTLDEKGGINAIKAHLNQSFSFSEFKNKRIQELNNLSQLSFSTVKRLREIYFYTMAKYVNLSIELNSDYIFIDKNPFFLGEVPLIYRVFPDAKFIFLVRHPLDTCLSCFMQDFELHGGTANFFSIEKTAYFYKQIINVWEKSRSIFNLKVISIHYENLIDHLPKTIDNIINFLGLNPDDNLINNYENNSQKTIIKTPSYSQINQGIYKNAKYRWINYEKQLEIIKPILEPFIKKYNY
ncbi:sulfotransferase [Cyanobacterium aponinum FACHB-4101]|uniref:tetratricopeptide repeat-containing sulfotransferase family protein n=1 Tax=Cyanobacterium aponinum TaxID=379064 RepID=UPI001680EC8D|nr:tetratricopeptide repeat-containing sulfotransferase family protein [Cyanobacterium aponinum]MBD2395643.1 sulfotransferase [Cyanobacterium aponinum FACHB-4101]